jgi:SAM-dependent methyltransferase
MFERLSWRNDQMLLDDLVFQLDRVGSEDLGVHDGSFHFYKSRPLIEQYAQYWKTNNSFRCETIFELGIWDGGSVAFWSEQFHPKKHVAVDIMKKKESPYLQRYIATRGLEGALRTFWEVDQKDGGALRRIVHSELPDGIDLVIDDASHIYEPTKISFETLFPFLRPGGVYIIEDWGWEFWDLRSTSDLATERGLTRLLHDVIGATASSPGLVSSVCVFQGFAAIERGGLRLPPHSTFQIERFISRRPPLSQTRARASSTLHLASRRARSALKRVSRAMTR